MKSVLKMTPNPAACAACSQDSSVSLACELLGLPLDQMQDVLEHKTLEARCFCRAHLKIFRV